MDRIKLFAGLLLLDLFFGGLFLEAFNIAFVFRFDGFALALVFGADLFESVVTQLFVHVRNDEGGEVNHFLQRTQGDVEYSSDLGWDAAQEPDVSDRSAQFNVAHAFTTNERVCDFYATLVTNNSLVADLFIFATITFPIFGRAKNFFGK